MSGNLSDDELWTLLCAPLAPYSEYRPNERASYRSGREIITGSVLWVSDGDGGQLYVVENDTTGFPDVVKAGEMEEPNG